jgi:hypothetical protein
MRVLLVTPPMVQFNTAYPAAPQLAAFLRMHGHEVAQADLSLGLVLRLLSPSGLTAVERALRKAFAKRRPPRSVKHFLQNARDIQTLAPDIVRFLQGELSYAKATISVPEGPRFKAMRGVPMDGDEEVIARHRASLFVDEIADAVHEGIDADFELSRYGERLAAHIDSFDSIVGALGSKPSLMGRWIDELAEAAFEAHRPELVGITVPFPGALVAAFRIARRLKKLAPTVITVLGGGYVNTELRELGDPRVFDHFDFVTYDDGEIPLLRIIEARQSASTDRLVRTRVRSGDRVVFLDDPAGPALRHRDRPAPDFAPLRSDGYLTMAESPNPMHRLWTERRWIKLTLAHGCYWHRCAFCDTSLDYIRRYDPADAETVVAWMEKAMHDTGLDGFHFVDEAAPPALLGNLSRLLIARGLRTRWWANIRFEKHFTAELASTMARAGCIAVSGGLECAHDRLLALMDKGITNAQAATAMRALSGAGLLVHAYLMYGYPTQTAQETIDALAYVRDLFEQGYLHSAFWHRFALTVHSPAFRDASKLRLRILDDRAQAFSRNESPFAEAGRADPGRFGEGLRRAIYNFMHGVGFDEDLRSWFDCPMPRPRSTQLDARPIAG